METMEQTFAKLTHGDKAELGDIILAYDFKPMQGRENYFVIGYVEGMGMNHNTGAASYQIRCIASSHGQFELDEKVYVPMQVAIMEYDHRIRKVTECFGNHAEIRQGVKDGDFEFVSPYHD